MPSSPEKTSYIILGIVAVLVLLLGVVAVAGMSRLDRNEQCRIHLSHVLMAVHSASPADAAAWDAVATGRRFFLELDKWPARSPRRLDASTFTCPVLGKTAPGNSVSNIDYRGPSKSVRDLAGTDVLAADRIGNHGPGEGGNLVLKSGEIIAAADGELPWVKAAQTTSD